MTFDYGRMNNTNFEYYKQGKLANLRGEITYGISSITRRSRTRKRLN